MEKRENSLILKTKVANRYSCSQINIALLKTYGGFEIVKSTQKSSEYSYLSLTGSPTSCCTEMPQSLGLDAIVIYVR